MTKDELDALAHRIAYSCSRSDIECFADELPISEGAYPRVHWYDLSKPIKDAFERTSVADALLYLEARGLILRDRKLPYLVTILDIAAESQPVLELEPAA